MEITKELKYGKFSWNENTKLFTLHVIDQDTKEAYKLVMNKIYAFSFLRFVVRVASRNWFRKIFKSKFTPEQIKECKDYLNLSVKEGYLDENTAQELVNKEDWKEVYDMMAKGDMIANDN